MDVRPSADYTPMCYHDPLLNRLTSESGLVYERAASDLQRIKISNGEPIPTLADLFAMWPHNLPILIEMKMDWLTHTARFVEEVARQVSAFPGKCAMMSFSEEAVNLIPKGIMRGQLIKPSFLKNEVRFQHRYARTLKKDIDYLALHVSDAETSVGAHLPTVNWTVRTDDQRRLVRDCGHAEIFEHLPNPLAASLDLN